MAKSRTKPETQKRIKRNWRRKQAHGADWRGIYDYYWGLCVNPEERPLLSPGKVDEQEIGAFLGDFCWGMCGVEIHEPFGEMKDLPLFASQGKMQQRVLLCKPCHQREHQRYGKRGFPMERGRTSLYEVDIAGELTRCGSYAAWVKKYNVGASYLGGQLAMGIEGA